MHASTSDRRFENPLYNHGSPQSLGGYPSPTDQTTTIQLAAQYEKCPLIPCLPEFTRNSAKSVARHQPSSELAGLQAALSQEGVPILRSCGQHLHDLKQQRTPAQPEVYSAHQKTAQQLMAYPGKQQQIALGAAVLSPQQQQAPSELVKISEDVRAARMKLHRKAASHKQPLPGSLAGQLGSLSPGGLLPAAHSSPARDRASLEQGPPVVQELRHQLNTCNMHVWERARRSCTPDKTHVVSQQNGQHSILANTPRSNNSSSQKLTAASFASQQHELLGLANSSDSTAQLATAFAQQVAQSKALKQLQQQGQQQWSEHSMAQLGLQQLQSITEAMQLVSTGVSTQRQATAEAQKAVNNLSSFLQQHPQYKNPAQLVSDIADKQQLEAKVEVLERELQATVTAHQNTLGRLREQSATPYDRRLAHAQHQNVALQQQLLQAKNDLAQFQHLAAFDKQHSSSGELSPVAAEGQRYDSEPALSRPVNRSLFSELQAQRGYASIAANNSSNSGSCPSRSDERGSAGSSRTCTPSSSSDSGSATAVIDQPTAHRYQAAGVGSSITAVHEAQLAAGRLLQQQWRGQDAAKQSPRPLTNAGGSSHGHSSAGAQRDSQRGRLRAGTSAADGMAQMQAQLEQQQQQLADIGASKELSHRRQLETERRKHQATQQQCNLLKQQEDQLNEQLQEANAKIKQLQQQCAENAKGSSLANEKLRQQQQQQREWLLQDSAIRELQVQLSQAQKANADMQQQMDVLLQQGQEHKSERRMQADRLLLAEQALQACHAKQDEVRQLKQQLQDTQTLLQQSQDSRLEADGALQECRRQLAQSDAEKVVLMDRIRQLADRASSADGLPHSNLTVSGAGDSCSGGGNAAGHAQEAHHQQQEQQRLQQELNGACAVLKQRVAGLQEQLSDAHAKQERLQVANAHLQEKLSRLQADMAARDAPDQCFSSSKDSPPQRHQQHLSQQVELLQQAAASWQDEKQQLQQQVEDLQKQLDTDKQTRVADGSAQPSQTGASKQQVQDDSEMQALVQSLRTELEERTQELEEWQIHADALEKDLDDLKDQVLAAESLQEQLQGAQAQLSATRSQQQQLQQELEHARSRASQLEYELHGVNQERAAMHARVDALTAELAAARQGAADLRLRLEHFTGPAGPQARLRQLETSLQNVQRKFEAAEARATSAAAHVAELTQQLGGAEDQIVTLEGHISLLEEELAKYTQLP